METMNELRRGLAEFEAMKQKINHVYTSVHFRENNTSKTQAPLATQGTELGDPLQNFLFKVGYKEKGSEANPGNRSKVRCCFVDCRMPNNLFSSSLKLTKETIR